MGASVSHECLIQELMEKIRSLTQRVACLETEAATLRKSVINNNVAHNELARKVWELNEHVFNIQLLQEGRSRSVRHHKSNKFHTQSLVLK